MNLRQASFILFLTFTALVTISCTDVENSHQGNGCSNKNNTKINTKTTNSLVGIWKLEEFTFEVKTNSLENDKLIIDNLVRKYGIDHSVEDEYLTFLDNGVFVSRYVDKIYGNEDLITEGSYTYMNDKVTIVYADTETEEEIEPYRVTIDSSELVIYSDRLDDYIHLDPDRLKAIGIKNPASFHISVALMKLHYKRM